MASRPFGAPPPPAPTDIDFVTASGNANWTVNGTTLGPWTFSTTPPTNPSYTFPDGTTGTTWDFDGTTWAITPQLSYTNAWTDDPIAINIWFYPTAFGIQLLTETDTVPDDLSGGLSGYNSSVLEIDSNGFVHAFFYNGTAAVSSTKVILNQWNHIYFAEIWTNDHYFEVNGLSNTTGNGHYARTSVRDFNGGIERFSIGGVSATNSGAGVAGRFQGKIGHVTISEYTASSNYSTYYDKYRPAPLALRLDAGNIYSYDGINQPTYWNDTVQSKVFTMYGSTPPTYSPLAGGSLVFVPGNENYAEAPSLPTANRWTVETWHYYDGSNSGSNPCIVTEVFAGGPINYILGIADGSGLRAAFFTGGWGQGTTGYTLTANTWYHIVGTFDGENLYLYINGTQVQSSVWPGATPTSSGQGLRLMRRWDNPEYWGGRLAIVRIYTGALIASNVQANFDAEKARFGL